ncbi:hypothetical protein ACWPM1_11930 [Tsuneonella sp. HG249]
MKRESYVGMKEDAVFDPLALARQWAAQWEKLANEHGTEWLAKPEAAQAMQGITGAALSMQAASKEASARVLAAANLPSKADIDALGQRLAAVEAALGRIEDRLRADDPAPSRPAVRRTRKPPTA